MNLLNISQVCHISYITNACRYVVLRVTYFTLYLTGLYNAWLDLRVVDSGLGLYLNP